MHNRKGIDWDSQPLGREPDVEIARRLGVCKALVGRCRKSRGIARFSRKEGNGTSWSINWDSQPLGKIKDVELAQKLGVCPTTVLAARRVRSIPSLWANVCDCGNGKSRGQIGCPSCSDGLVDVSVVARAIFAELGHMGRSNWEAIREALKGYSHRNLYRGMNELASIGLVTRHGDGNEQAEFELRRR